MKYSLLATGVAVLLLLSSTVVSAQFDTDVIQEATPTQAEVGELTESFTIQEARDEYVRSVEQYRESEQKYLISQEQYYQLNTVASLDEAIRRAKDVLRLRVITLRNYNTYLDRSLRATTGIDLGDKSQALNDLAAMETLLTQYEISYGDLNQRSEVDQAFEQLNAQRGAINSIAYRVQTLIKIGELQTAIDTAQGANEAIDTQLSKAQISAADRAIKQRGLQEATLLLNSAQTSSFALLEDYRKRTSSSYNLSAYDQFINGADSTYLRLRQAFAYLEEVLKGIE